MKRRSFVKASLVTGSFAAGIAPLVSKATKNDDMEKISATEFYELRVYTLKNESAAENGGRLFSKCCYTCF